MGVDPVSRILPPENGTAPARAIPPGSTTRVPRPGRNGRRRRRRHGRLSGAAGALRWCAGWLGRRLRMVCRLAGPDLGVASWRRVCLTGLASWRRVCLTGLASWRRVCLTGPSCVLDRTGVLASCVLEPGGALPCVCWSRVARLASCVLWPGRALTLRCARPWRMPGLRCAPRSAGALASGGSWPAGACGPGRRPRSKRWWHVMRGGLPRPRCSGASGGGRGTRRPRRPALLPTLTRPGGGRLTVAGEEGRREVRRRSGGRTPCPAAGGQPSRGSSASHR